VCGALRDSYGSDSPELKGFLEVRFELGGPTEAAQRRMEKVASAHPWLSGVEFSNEHYYLERLNEAAEYLLSLILPGS
jgi:hypothetical protein